MKPTSAYVFVGAALGNGVAEFVAFVSVDGKYKSELSVIASA
jgi:hypothetical protein